jgi:hypothetical protein
MRPYRLAEETLDQDDEHPHVVPIIASSRPRASSAGLTGRPQPWTARDVPLPTAPTRTVESATTAPAAGRLSPMQKWMIGTFLVICVGMILGMVMVRVWDTASRTVAALPPEGSQPAARASANLPAGTGLSAAAAGSVSAAPGTGPISTEIQTLQPNYTVAPGDTLGNIARKHGTSVDALASINNLENRNSLSVGQKLIIP